MFGTTIIWRGDVAALDGVPLASCPYTTGSSDRDLWVGGWRSAVDFSEWEKVGERRMVESVSREAPTRTPSGARRASEDESGFSGVNSNRPLDAAAFSANPPKTGNLTILEQRDCASRRSNPFACI
jgi:ribosome modulation factor